MPRKRASLGIMDDEQFREAKLRAKQKPTPEMTLKMKRMEKRSILAKSHYDVTMQHPEMANVIRRKAVEADERLQAGAARALRYFKAKEVLDGAKI